MTAVKVDVCRDFSPGHSKVVNQGCDAHEENVPVDDVVDVTFQLVFGSPSSRRS